MVSLNKIKTWRSHKAWWATFWSVFLSPLGSIENLLPLLSFPVVLFLVKILAGEESGVSMAWDAIKEASIFAVLWSVVVYITLAAVIASFKFRNNEKEKGQWFDRRFVYSNPQLVLTHLASSKDNGKKIPFKCGDAEKNSLVTFRLVSETTDQLLIKATINGIKAEPMMFVATDAKRKVRIGSDRAMYLMTEMADIADDSIIRVFVLSFEV